MSRKKKADPQEKLVESATVGPKRSKQTGARDWDAHYRRGAPAWRSSGVGKIARQFLSTVAPGSSLLEVGCGFGDDATHIVGLLVLGCSTMVSISLEPLFLRRQHV